MHPSRAPNGTLHRKEEMAAWPFSGLCSGSDPTLFQMTLFAALLATVLGNCGPPPELAFASHINKLDQTNFTTGTTLRYACRPGYSRFSSNQNVVCTRDGTWFYEDNFCNKKRCRNPGDLPNGHVEIKTDLSLGSQIEFSCSEGYILTGSTTSHCVIQDKGVEWSNPFPVCVIAKCEPPPKISNGKHNGGDEEVYTYGSSITYNCDPPFSLLGNASISCTVENKTIGVWSPSPPTCKQIICPSPDIPHGKIISGFGPIYHYKDSIVLTCQKGSVLRGNSVIHCEADSKWNPSPPTCELNSCIDLPDIPHASWIGYPRPRKGDMYQPGTVLRYQCNSGYKPDTNEPTTVTCERNFRWSPFKGCKKVYCPRPEFENVVIIQPKETYFYGDVVSYMCHDNKMFSAVCKSDGTWQPRKPSCDHNCKFPPKIAHGRYKLNSNFFGSEATYECDEGYTLVGEEKLSCDFSRWLPAVPQCKARCLKPEIENGKLSVDKEQYTESENVTISCNSGFLMVGPQSIACSENATWYPQVPTCEWEVLEGCEQVLKGRKLTQCLPDPDAVKMALEVYKLSLEIELLELERDKARQSVLKSSL
ncbi:C4b-binding protein alpha chain [Castor canadensis]|uniref:C4b-binding protein alpha chain-like n=3 Tax=Castor canadensis TaxID=51338 RepID=A0A8C0X440_CASCN|nr:C4b-binding protein alpha chain-like [Castor canadensis]